MRLCRERAQREGLQSVETYADAAISGASVILRPGIKTLLADAQGGRFDVVMAEALDRLSRDQEDIAALFKRLRFAGVRIVTLSEGMVDELHVGLKGTMNALFLRDLAAKIKIKRGQIDRVVNGYSAGGLSYSYRVVRKLDERGEPIRGLREVDEEQAGVIRRIFNELASDMSARMIAASLNRDGIPPPVGGTGGRFHDQRQSQAAQRLPLQRSIGLLVFNRVQMVKDPETGKRVSRPNPPEQRQVVEAPHLRIISDELLDAVQARKKLYVVELHPASIEAYRHKVAELQNALHTDDNERREAANVIRSLVTSIEVMLGEGRGELELSVHGVLAELLNLPHRKTGELPRTALW